MHQIQISKKTAPTQLSKPQIQKVSSIPTYGSLSSVIQRAQSNNLSTEEWLQLDSAIGTRATQEIRAGKKTDWRPEFRSISKQLPEASGFLGNSIQTQETKSTSEVVPHNYAFNTVQRIGSDTEVATQADKTPLVKDRLNVVGEDHIESGREIRRRCEKSYTAQYSGSSSYWLEHEFRVRGKTFSEKVRSRFHGSDKRPTADPFKLRFLQKMVLIEQYGIPNLLGSFEIINRAKQIGESERKTLTEELTKYFDALIEDMTGDIYASLRWLEQLSQGKDGFELSQEDKTKFLEYKPNLDNIKNQYIMAMITLFIKAENNLPEYFNEFIIHEEKKFFKKNKPKNKLHIEARNNVDNAREIVQRLEVTTKAIIDSLKSQLKIENPLDFTAEKIIEMRSISMHEAAKNRWEKKGVWKIGDFHVEDIKKLFPSDIKYNLVTREEFNKHFYTKYPMFVPNK